jgi:hypothetical protein
MKVLKPKWIQRDLEDQIQEEKKKQQSNMAQTSTLQQVTVEEILDLLSKGYSRYKDADRGYGSIQAKYNLTRAQVARLFKNPRLVGRKTKNPGVILIDESVEQYAEADLQRRRNGETEIMMEMEDDKENEDLFS